MNLRPFHDQPAKIRLFPDDTPAGIDAIPKNTDWQAGDVIITVLPTEAATVIRIHAPQSRLSRVALRWPAVFADGALFLGDAWERGYGDLQWRTIQPERYLPWYFAAYDPSAGVTGAVGVKTQPAAICFWTIDPAGVTLWLDLHNGGSPSVPGDRIIEAATVVTQISDAGEPPASVIGKLCRQMCDKPRITTAPVCGNNNWYYAYGQNFDANQVRRDAALLADLAGDHTNRPYCVIDAGWSPGGVCPGGPWTAGRPDKFPDMPGLAEDLIKAGVQPGIWIRPTSLSVITDRRLLRPGPQKAAEKAIDLTLPENLQRIREDVHRMNEWGYRLIKHDFSTYDALGRWGFEMAPELTDAGWHFADRSLTNAEIILRLYQTIREGAGDSILIGCDTIGHLGAGLFELQRAGDDTSGKIWERTRRMGVNTLAYRLPQNGTFFTIDADCVAHTENIPWEKTRQWLDLVSRSGTALFVSVDPTKITPEVKTAMSTAMRSALTAGKRSIEPLDWITSTCPEKWKIDRRPVEYDWIEPVGAWPMKC